MNKIVVVDASVLILAAAPAGADGRQRKKDAVAALRTLADAHADVRVPAPAYAEMLMAAQGEAELEAAARLAGGIEVEEFDGLAAAEAAGIMRAIWGARRSFGANRNCIKYDVMCVAIAVAQGAEVVLTDDGKPSDWRRYISKSTRPGLRLETPASLLKGTQVPLPETD